MSNIAAACTASANTVTHTDNAPRVMNTIAIAAKIKNIQSIGSPFESGKRESPDDQGGQQGFQSDATLSDY
jgi:hypothetical protein